MKMTHYWDCSGQGCDAATLQPWDEHKYISPPGYGPQDPADFGGALFGEKMWLTGAASDALSGLMGPDDGCCGEDPNDGGVGGCGKCALVQNPDSRHPDWTAVVMKKNRCPPWSNGCGAGEPHFDVAAPGFDNLQWSTANVCGIRPGTGFESQGQSETLGSWWSRCADTAECADLCDELPADFRKGCRLFASWGWQRGDPERVKFRAVECPAAFVEHVSSSFGASGPTAPSATPSPSPQPAPSPPPAAPAPATTQPPTKGQVFQGTITMWGTQDNLIGSQCEYANAPVNSLTDTVLPSYLRSGFHCAIGDSAPGFGLGEHCGKCYRLTSLSDSGTSGTPGSRGSAVVMVSNGGAGGAAHFDCILESFKEITGAETGIFDVEFEETPCEEVTGGLVAINWADQNAYYCKMLFGNVGGWGQLQSVRACLDGSNCRDMQRFSGATWTGCPTGTGSAMTFELTQRSPSGTEAMIACECPGEWPWITGKRCVCPDNFAVVATS